MDRERLVKLLGMTGSSHAGEAGNAALMAGKLLKEHDLTWDDVIVRAPEAKPKKESATGRRRKAGTAGPAPSAAKQAAKIILRNPDITEWEVKFLKSVLLFDVLSQKQKNTLYGICVKYGYIK